MIGGEIAPHRCHTHQQQRRATVLQRITGPRIQLQFTLRPKHVGEPTASITQRFGVGMEHCPPPFPLQQGLEASGVAAIGELHSDATSGGDAGCRQLRGHAAGAPATTVAGPLFELVQLPGVANIRDRFGIGINPRIGGIKAVNIREQDQLLRFNSGGHQSRKGVVVAEAQLRRREGIVLVDHRQHPPAQQLPQGARSVLIATAIGQIGAGQQHLSHGIAVAFHRPFIKSHQRALPDGCSGLQSHNRVRSAGESQLLAAQPNGTTGDQHHLIPPGHGPCEAAGVAINRGGGLPPKQAGTDFHDPQGHAEGAPMTRAMARSNRCTRSWRQGLPSSRTGRTNTV